MCMGFIVGIADILGGLTSEGSDAFGLRACIPTRSTPEQVRDIVVKRLADHPDVRHLPAVFIAVTALAEAFPCR